MDSQTRTRFLLALLFLCFVPLRSQDLQTYIVQLHPNGISRTPFGSRAHWHLSVLDGAVSSSEDSPAAASRLLYSYGSAMEGFSARLSEAEIEALRNSVDVISIKPDRRIEVQTTYSYKFLGLSVTEGAWVKSRFGCGTIIGLLDTGVWPESPSFDDAGMPPAPGKWKGVCQEGQGFNSSSCNRKLIGARFFSKGHVAASPDYSPHLVEEYISPRDSHGHGTHTASTAAGSPVSTASVLGNAAGEARGMAPSAHVAIYKVCWYNGCYSSDILAAMDAAIVDGVDVLSLSLGGFPVPIFEDTIAIGSFRATEHGIAVVAAAGNNGPLASSVSNESPWINTVGASTLNRRFPGIVHLGNGKFLYGESLFPGKAIPGSQKKFDLVYVTGNNSGSEFCLRGSLPKTLVRGKMVVCDRGINGRAEKGEIVKEAGGVAMILANTALNLEEDSVDVHLLPATLIGFDESITLKSYINSTRKPRARIIFAGTRVGKSRAPAVAQFSSRGPSFTDPAVLKPDVIAPGVNIIAAWPQNLGPSGLPEDPRRVNFTVMSGTSMACPHVSGLAALLRAAHPYWSPAAIKSALVTTADTTDHQGKPIMDGDKAADVFAMGAGHVNPEKAIDPGLIYDIHTDDYITHLCSLGYTTSEILSITHKNISCRETLRENRGFSLNYPSISITFRPGMTRKIVTRKVTNVGAPGSTYTAKVVAPEGVKVRVKPQRLKFKRANQRLEYAVWFTSRQKFGRQMKRSFAEGQLTWVNTRNNGVQRVRSPISVTWVSKKRNGS